MTEREKYVAALEEKLRKAGKAKRFVGSEDGEIITDYLITQINGIVKNIGGTKYLNDHQAYVYELGQMFMAQKILNMLDANANTDTETINNSLEEARNDG
ncbi:MAG TPA: hypothetical protein PKV66_01100 [Candidatus Pelethenecus sp.]|nr:hypothetical protein [Candidatus Pelethenecus sp.]